MKAKAEATAKAEAKKIEEKKIEEKTEKVEEFSCPAFGMMTNSFVCRACSAKYPEIYSACGTKSKATGTTGTTSKTKRIGLSELDQYIVDSIIYTDTFSEVNPESIDGLAREVIAKFSDKKVGYIDSLINNKIWSVYRACNDLFQDTKYAEVIRYSLLDREIDFTVSKPMVKTALKYSPYFLGDTAKAEFLSVCEKMGLM